MARSLWKGPFFIPLFIMESMIGSKLGEFVFTRKRAVHVRKSGSKKK
jgi:ribosomal protein S19